MSIISRLSNFFSPPPKQLILPTSAGILESTRRRPPPVGSTYDLEKAIDVVLEANPNLSSQLNKLRARPDYGGQSYIDLPPGHRERLLSRARQISISNPVAKRGLDIRANLIVSEGFTPKATCTDLKLRKILQKVLDTHWDINEWEGQLDQRVLDLSLTGEWFRYIPDLNYKLSNGKTYQLSKFKAGALLPEEVASVKRALWDQEQIDSIHMRDGYNMEDDCGIKVIRKEWSGPESGRLTGNVFYQSINRSIGATRGLSDLTSVIEWLDILDQLLFNEAERSSQLLKFLYDITLVGGSQEAIDRRTEELKLRPPSRGTSIVHNEKEIWTTVQPSTSAAESDVLINRIFLFCWGGLGLPEHWYSAANTVNKSSAGEMSTPVMMWARKRKRQVVAALSQELEMAIQVAYDAGVFGDANKEDLTFSIDSRDPDRTGYDAVGTSLKSIAEALVMATASQFMALDDAQRIFVHVANSLGLELSEDAAAKVNMDPNKAMQMAANKESIIPLLRSEYLNNFQDKCCG